MQFCAREAAALQFCAREAAAPLDETLYVMDTSKLRNSRFFEPTQEGIEDVKRHVEDGRFVVNLVESIERKEAFEILMDILRALDASDKEELLEHAEVTTIFKVCSMARFYKLETSTVFFAVGEVLARRQFSEEYLQGLLKCAADRDLSTVFDVMADVTSCHIDWTMGTMAVCILDSLDIDGIKVALQSSPELIWRTVHLMFFQDFGILERLIEWGDSSSAFFDSMNAVFKSATDGKYPATLAVFMMAKLVSRIAERRIYNPLLVRCGVQDALVDAIDSDIAPWAKHAVLRALLNICDPRALLETGALSTLVACFAMADIPHANSPPLRKGVHAPRSVDVLTCHSTTAAALMAMDVVESEVVHYLEILVRRVASVADVRDIDAALREARLIHGVNPGAFLLVEMDGVVANEIPPAALTRIGPPGYSGDVSLF